MTMTFSPASGALRKLRRTSWRFQRTFQTPLRQLEPFVSAILGTEASVTGASLTIDALVFEPRHLLHLLTNRGKAVGDVATDTTIAAESREEAHALLTAALADWLDFHFVPRPKHVVIYADHDEYCTFYANSQANLNPVCERLVRAGFAEVDGFERTS